MPLCPQDATHTRSVRVCVVCVHALLLSRLLNTYACVSTSLCQQQRQQMQRRDQANKQRRTAAVAAVLCPENGIEKSREEEEKRMRRAGEEGRPEFPAFALHSRRRVKQRQKIRLPISGRQQEMRSAFLSGSRN